ncbi:MAG TPA: PAS domain S-box protein, partial [Bacilli bacterium]|nr:PAS domain S-box protein [Bacilli bacterium]
TIELKIKHKNGQWIYILDSGKVVAWDENEKPIIVAGISIDFTAQKKIELENRTNAQVLKEIIDNTKDIIYRTDGRGQLTYLSDSISTSLGYERKTSIGKFLQNFVHPEDLRLFVKYFEDKTSTFAPNEYITFRIKHHNGTWRTFETIASTLLNEKEFIGYVGVARDITQIQEIDQALKEQRAEMERFFKVNVDLFCIVDSDGILTKVNKAWETTLGYPLKYLLNKPLTAFVHPDEKDETIANIKKVIEDKFEAKNIIKRYRKIDGTYCYLEWNAIPYEDMLYASVRDISSRMEAQRQLRNEKEHFKATLMSVGDAIIVTDKHGIISEINNMALKLTGYSFENAIGRQFDDVYKIFNEKTDEPIINIIENVIDKKQAVKLNNIYLITKKNRKILLDDSIAPILDIDGNVSGVVIAFRDVSESKDRLRKIEYLSYHDQLTDLYNRHYLDRTLKEINKRKNFPLAIVSLDLNDLKYINDNYGHHFGDLALKKTASAIKRHVRTLGYSFRIGGDEFLAFLPNTSLEKVNQIVSAINKDIVCAKTSTFPLSVAIGVNVLESRQDEIYAGIKVADDKMYLDKAKAKKVQKQNPTV